MKKVGIVLVGIVILVGVIYCLPKEEREVLIEEKESSNTSLAFYLEQEDGNYIESTNLPQTGYTLNTEKSVCTNNTTPVWKENKLYLNNLKDKGTSCYLYFQKLCPTVATACESIVANNPNISDERSGEITGPLTENTTGTLFTAEDDNGTSLVFAGDIDNNWISFAGYYWRIIRINGDGSIRMIYSGENTGSVTDANRTGETTQIGTSAFNEQSNDNAYVGYMYGTPGSNTYEETHANINASTIKTVLDTWYQTNLEKYSNYIDAKEGFCNDRKPVTGAYSSSSYGTLAYGTNPTTYAPFGRLYANDTWKINQTPTLKCSQTNDYFTMNRNGQGNGTLTYPIGLITADEAVLAGGFGAQNNTNYYLYTGQMYWTMSPSGFNETYSTARLVQVYPPGRLVVNYSYLLSGVRPVINLRADVTLSGTGTSTDPYIVEGAA